MSKTFKFAGFARNPAGQLKFWVGQTAERAQDYVRAGWTDVSGFALPEVMTKAEAREYAGPVSVKSGPVKSATVRVSKKKIAARSEIDEPLTRREAAEIRAEFNDRVAAAYEAN